MKNENEKKGLFYRLRDNKKPKKSSCCCNFELEEIPEEKEENKDEGETSKNNGKSCC